MPYLRAYDGTAEALGANSNNNSKIARTAMVRATDPAGAMSFVFIFVSLSWHAKLAIVNFLNHDLVESSPTADFDRCS